MGNATAGLPWLPSGWVCAAKDCKLYEANRDWIENIARACASRYRGGIGNGIGLDDLQNVARAMALYGVSSWDDNRGVPLKPYVIQVVKHALAMYMAPYFAEKRRPVGGFVELGWATSYEPDSFQVQSADMEIDGTMSVERFRSRLSAAAAKVFDCFGAPVDPVEMALGRRRPTVRLIAEATGLAATRVERCLQEIRQLAQNEFLAAGAER